MEKLDFKQAFIINGIPFLMATEHSFRGVFLAGRILGILMREFGIDNLSSVEDLKEDDYE